MNEIFNELFYLDVNEHAEEKNGLTYLSWAWAWAEVKKKYPTADYDIERFGEEKKPYLYDDNLGYMVFTTVTIEGLTHEMWLPAMDHRNNPMMARTYTMKKWGKDVTVQKATMFDINKTIMRCLVKNLAMHGLGLYIYSGEDLPEAPPEPKVTKEQASTLEEKVAELSELTGEQDAAKKLNRWLVGKFSINGQALADVSANNYQSAINALDQMIKNNLPDEESEEAEQTSLMDGNTTKVKEQGSD